MVSTPRLVVGLVCQPDLAFLEATSANTIYGKSKLTGLGVSREIGL